MKYVIIGNSAAGIGAVEGIRATEAACAADKRSEITVITNEPYHTYSRPLISYFLLGKVTEETMKYRGDNFYADNDVSLLSGVTVTKIDAVKKLVFLSDNGSVPYDRLLVAAGSSPFTPPFEGLDSVKDKFTFMSLDDAKKLNEALEKNNEKAPNKKRALIIGAGLIGLKCAEGISKRVSEITIVDLAPRILSSILDEDGAEIVRAHIEKECACQGTEIKFMLARSVKKFEKNSAVFENGDVVNFDVLVLAVGVQPNTSLLKDIAEIDRGIIVNGESETSVKDIYAAGDCTQTLDISSGQSKIMALLPNAYMQGECAGVNMVGGEKSFDRAIPMNAIGFFGLHMITAGNYSGETYVKRSDKADYKKLFYSDNRLNGYILIGNVEKAGIYTSIIRERTPLDSIDFALVCEKPGLMAFTKEERMARLGAANNTR